ncbi:hypothetical protein DFH06DRAFT_1143753 [Mycena polygramma]|nr:hypothetical protein DFH06DRAFT_1143753 [Mycena polygramma]
MSPRLERDQLDPSSVRALAIPPAPGSGSAAKQIQDRDQGVLQDGAREEVDEEAEPGGNGCSHRKKAHKEATVQEVLAKWGLNKLGKKATTDAEARNESSAGFRPAGSASGSKKPTVPVPKKNTVDTPRTVKVGTVHAITCGLTSECGRQRRISCPRFSTSVSSGGGYPSLGHAPAFVHRARAQLQATFLTRFKAKYRGRVELSSLFSVRYTFPRQSQRSPVHIGELRCTAAFKCLSALGRILGLAVIWRGRGGCKEKVPAIYPFLAHYFRRVDPLPVTLAALFNTYNPSDATLSRDAQYFSLKVLCVSIFPAIAREYGGKV